MIISEARKWLNTRFHHQGRVMGAGVDCAGVIIAVAQALGYQIHDVQGYSRLPHKNKLQEHLEQDLDKIDQLENGCVLLMRFDMEPQHLAIYNAVDNTIIHAYQSVGKCVEHTLDETWRNRITGIYRFREPK